jgi:long-chain acyl-CoA synthetase
MKLHIDVRRRLFKEVIDQLGGALRFVFSGASALDPEVVKGFETMGISVVQGYGMTESSPVIATESAKERRPGSIGKALYGVDVELLDPNEEGIGEIICHSPSVMKGYFEDPEETAKTLIDGWLHTGDLARMDQDGFLFITGRAKNVIVLKNGKNVYPEEMETLIANIPYVKENIVISQEKRKNEANSELALCAKIVYDPKQMKEDYHAETQEEIEKVIWQDLEKINQELPKYKRITRLIAQDQEMSKTTTGKVRRFEEGATRAF